MERYLEQLIEDLHAARKNAPVNVPQSQLDDQQILEELREIDRIIEQEHEKPMHLIFGIDPSLFPPYENLNEEQAANLAEEIIELFLHFNIDPVYPENYPKEKLYPLLIQKLNEPFLYFPMGMTHLELCNFESSKCPFENGYCNCKECGLF